MTRKTLSEVVNVDTQAPIRLYKPYIAVFIYSL